MTTTHDIVTGGIAALSTDAGEDDVGGGTLVNGVALGEDDVTEGMSGTRTRWPKPTLEKAADLLVGKPITKQLGEGHVGVEKTTEGLKADPVVPLQAKVGEVTQAKYRDGVGLMWQGSIKDPEMAEKVEQGLAQVSPVLQRDVEPVDDEDDLFEATEITAIRDLGLVANGASPGNAIQAGAAEAMTVEALAQAFDEPAESGEDPRDDDDPDGTADGGTGQSTEVDDGPQFMDPDDITDAEFEMLAASRQMDDPKIVESADAERLGEADGLLAQADEHDNPIVVDEDDYEGLTENTETVRTVLQEALVERTDLKEGTVEALSFEALCGEFENDDGEFDAEALVQTPETGTAGGDGNDSPGVDDDARERIGHIREKLDTVGKALPDARVEALHEEAATLADADDYDAALTVIDDE